MKRRSMFMMIAVAAAAGLVMAGCTQAAPTPAPTTVPAKAVEPAKAAAPAAAPTKAAEPTKAPAAQPTAVPAPKVTFPEKGKAMTILVPYAAGGTVDTAGRLLAPVLEKQFGTSVQVVNKAGASTQVAATELVRSKPDGYTIGFVTIPTTLGTYLDPQFKAIYTRKDFAPVANYLFEPQVLVVKGDSRYKDVKDVVDAAKGAPGKLKMGTAGLKSGNHLAGLGFQKLAGIDFAFVQFDGGSQSLTALLGESVDAVTVSSGATMAQAKSGAIRLIGIMDRQESKFYPGVKTLEAQGYKAHFANAFGIVAPAATPKEIVNTLTGAIKTALESPDLQQRIEAVGQSIRYMDPSQYAAFWAEEEPKTKELLELADQQPAR